MQHSSLLPGRAGSSGYTARLLVYSCIMLMLFAVLAFTPLSSAVQAASPRATTNVKMTARSLFQGWFKYGDWLPVEISLENYGEAATVRVEAQVVTRISGSNYTTNYQREVALGERANKRFTLYLIPYVETTNPSRSITYDTTITLRSNERSLSEQKVQLLPVNPTDYIVGVINQDPNTLSNNLSNLKVGGRSIRVGAVGMGLADIPDQGIGLRSFNSLIIGEVSTETLSNDQRAALREWVEAGGQLILLGGNSWSKVRSAFPPAILPLDVTNYANISSLDGLVSPNGDEIKASTPLSRPATMARGQVLQGARLLSYLPDGSNVLPVAAERRLGTGRIVASSLDFSVPPLLDWSGGSQVWQEFFNFNITPFNPLYQEPNPQIKNSQDMLGFVSNVPELRLPDISLFFLLILGYVLIAGPLNFLVLKKIGHLEYAWVTLPVLGILFMGVALNYANSQPPGEVLISQLSVVQTGIDQEQAQVRSYAALFSPTDRNYDVGPNLADATVRSLITPLNRYNSTLIEGEPPRRALQGEKPRMDDFQIGQWSAQGLSLESTVAARNFQLVADLRYEDNKIVGTVRNQTGGAIRNTILMLGDQIVKFKDVIEAGETVPVEFAMPSPTAAVVAFCSTNVSATTSTFSGSTPGERLAMTMLQDRRDDKVTQTRASFVRKLYESGRYSPLNIQRGLDLIGWLDQNPMPLMVNGVTSQSKSSQVLFARLPVDFEARSGDGRFVIPAMGLIPQSVTSSTGNLPLTNRFDRTDQVCLNRGSVTVQFLMPPERGPLKVKKLTLYVNAFTQTGRREPTLPESVELYNFQSKSWEIWTGLTNSALQTNIGSNFSNQPPPIKNVMEDAGRFTDPQTGRILLRLNSNSSNTIFFQHSLEIEGTFN